MRIEFLNHSSFLLDNGQTSLLVDPWLTGSAFAGGWELEWENPHALDVAARADYVWISHPHSDHMHFETLKLLLARNPALKLLGNSNPMIDLNVILGSLPFANRIPVPERRNVALDPDTTLFVIPSLAIDSVMAYLYEDLFVLNVNDAVLDGDLTRSILDKNPTFCGRVPDVLSLNFSHANKVLESEADRVCAHYVKRLAMFIDIFKPRLCLPVCSFQLYSGDLAQWQNAHRVLPEDIAGVHECVHTLFPGDVVTLTKDDWQITQVPHTRAQLEPRDYGPSQSLSALQAAFARYANKSRREFFVSALLPPPINIRFRDLDQTVCMDFRQRQLAPLEQTASWDIECHSSQFGAAIGKPYGLDAFYVGADYSVAPNPKSEKKVKNLVFKGCLIDYSITPRNISRSVFNRAKWRYALNRAEQSWRILTKGDGIDGT